jgi:hypothetical protein
MSKYKELYRTYAEMEANVSVKNLKRWREKYEKNVRAGSSKCLPRGGIDDLQR